MQRTIRLVKPSAPRLPAKKRVAAYARVSTGKEAMLQSLATQVGYYSSLIQKHPGWEYAGVYADEALTGTKDDRQEFQRLLSDCRARKIDMVITKSISRFARNTVTMLETVRELKALNIDVFFEKENIHSLSGDGELMLTILASFAQEESRSVSENCKWRIRKRFQAGDPVSWRFMYGYRIHKGEICIHPEQAEVVRSVFTAYVSGIGTTEIARSLRERNIPCQRGGTWTPKRIIALLKNEKYAGNALLQKKYVADHLSKAEKRNHGVLPMYYAENTHEGIIDTETFEAAQSIMKANQKKSNIADKAPATYPFTSRITCGQCGKHFKRKLSRSEVAWNCGTYLTFGKTACPAKQIPENVLMTLSADILGLTAFDACAFAAHISEIKAFPNNTVVFVFRDGHEIARTWQDKSRSDSWDDAARQRAREHAERRYAK